MKNQDPKNHSLIKKIARRIYSIKHNLNENSKGINQVTKLTIHVAKDMTKTMETEQAVLLKSQRKKALTKLASGLAEKIIKYPK